MNVLLIGGAGYIGSIIANDLEKKSKVKKIIILDWLIYSNQKYKIKKNSKKIHFFNKNFLNIIFLKKTIQKFKITDIIILGGLVGDPITKKYPDLNNKINYHGILNVINFLKKNLFNKLIFVSTCSNYGIVKNKIADENTTLKPKSLYANAKVEIEKKIKEINNTNFSWCILRFATAFGFSPRMRFDLTINDFTRDAISKNKIEIYDPDTWRPYCHVKDFSRVIFKIMISNNKLIHKKIYNVGSNKNNHTKRSIAKILKIKFKKLELSFLKKPVDPRDYRVSFTKLKKELKITPKYSLQYGINEISENYKSVFKEKDTGNYKIRKKIYIK